MTKESTSKRKIDFKKVILILLAFFLIHELWLDDIQLNSMWVETKINTNNSKWWDPDVYSGAEVGPPNYDSVRLVPGSYTGFLKYTMAEEKNDFAKFLDAHEVVLALPAGVRARMSEMEVSVTDEFDYSIISYFPLLKPVIVNHSITMRFSGDFWPGQEGKPFQLNSNAEIIMSHIGFVLGLKSNKAMKDELYMAMAEEVLDEISDGIISHIANQELEEVVNDE